MVNRCTGLIYKHTAHDYQISGVKKKKIGVKIFVCVNFNIIFLEAG